MKKLCLALDGLIIVGLLIGCVAAPAVPLAVGTGTGAGFVTAVTTGVLIAPAVWFGATLISDSMSADEKARIESEAAVALAAAQTALIEDAAVKSSAVVAASALPAETPAMTTATDEYEAMHDPRKVGVRVVMVDDSAVVAESTEYVFMAFGGVLLPGSTWQHFWEFGQFLLQFEGGIRWDVYILDGSIGKLTGSEVAGLIRRVQPNATVVVMSGDSWNVPDGVKYISKGAKDSLGLLKEVFRGPGFLK